MERRNLEIEARTFRSLGRACRNSNLNSEAGVFFDKAGDSFGIIYEDYGEAEEERRRRDYDNVIASYQSAEEAYNSAMERDKVSKVYRKVMDFRFAHPEYLSNPERVWLFIRKYTSDYGESTRRFFAWTFAIIVFFALIYIPVGFLQPILMGLLIIATLLTSIFGRRRGLAIALDISEWLQRLLKAFMILEWFEGLQREFTVLGRMRITRPELVIFPWSVKLRKQFIIATVMVLTASLLSYTIGIDGCNIFKNPHKTCVYDFFRGFYISFTTFSTLGFGDVEEALNIAAVIAIFFEVLSGYVMFGVLITMLARKIIR